jgi:hypothetical protein
VISLDVALSKVRAFLVAAAPLTPIKSDDAAIVVIDALLHDGRLFGWFGTKVAEDDNGVLSLESTPPVALQVVLEQRQIDWAKLLEFLPTIITLVRMFRGA